MHACMHMRLIGELGKDQSLACFGAVHAGSLSKKGAYKVSSWRTRWCVLDREGGMPLWHGCHFDMHATLTCMHTCTECVHMHARQSSIPLHTHACGAYAHRFALDREEGMLRYFDRPLCTTAADGVWCCALSGTYIHTCIPLSGTLLGVHECSYLYACMYICMWRP